MDRPQPSRPSTIPWPPLLFAAALALAVALGRYVPLPWPGMDDLPARLIGRAIGASGVVLTVWAAVTLYRAGTTVLPHKGSTHLVRSGPFRIWRNPIYMGEVLIVLGLAELTQNIWFAFAAVLFALGLLVLAIVPEERYLEERFGDDYLAYKSGTRRWF